MWYLKIDTESDKEANEYIQHSLLSDKSNNLEQYAAAAEYFFYLDQALVLMDKAIAKKSESWYYRLKIDILEKTEEVQRRSGVCSSCDLIRSEKDRSGCKDDGYFRSNWY